jgi:hypothetical protein
MTTQRSVRWISEQDSGEQELSSNALLSWKLNHGTASCLGYQDTVDTHALSSTQRALFAKLGLPYRPGVPLLPDRPRPGPWAASTQARSPQVLARLE